MNRLSPLPLLAAGLALLLGLPAAAVAQMAPLDARVEMYTMSTGAHANAEGATARVAHAEVVEVKEAPWLRLQFSEVALGKESYLTVTSLRDGYQQRLDAEAMAVWNNSSAFFNGDAVRVELHVAPGDEGVSVRMNQVFVGEAGDGGAPESQCGPTDDRVASNDPRAGRLLDMGCTAWLIEDGRFVTAGHCLNSFFPATVVEFNVPPSTSSGAIQHPAPEDQYTVISSSEVFTDGGVGNDWGLFQTDANTQTGLTALEAQGGFYEVVQDLSPSTIRITGYGVDDSPPGSSGGRNADNQTQQTNAGPSAGSSGTTMRYRADTEGGNSGSPVIDEATGRAVGVHTHGGCSFNSNKGTSTFNAAFWQEVNAEFPVAAFSPSLSEGLEAALAAGETGPVDLTITNTGSGDLDFDFIQYSNRGGGPDAFGYGWTDSNDPGGPVFDFVDIAGTGTALSLSDDDGAFVALPFAFPFYGDDKTQVGISSNGYLTFDDADSTPSDYTNDLIPTAGTPNDLIAVYWDDFDPGNGSGGGGTVYYEDLGDGRFVVQWDEVPHFPDGDGELVTFQAILNADGTMLFQYLSFIDDASEPNSGTIGIENATGTIGLEIAANEAYVEDGLAVLIETVPSFVTGVTPASGTVPEGQSVTVTVGLSAAGLEEDTYLNNLAIVTNEPGSYAYPVRLTVTDGGGIGLMASSTTPLTVAPGGSVSFDYTVTNNTGSAATGDVFFVARSGGSVVSSGIVQSGTLQGGDAVSASFTQAVPASAPAGTYDYTINVGTFPSSAIASAPFTITVTGTATRPAGPPSGSAWSVSDTTPWALGSVAGASAVAAGADGPLGVYPNPFSGQARIAFALDAEADVRVAVYDVLGREVAVLVDGAREAGRHETVFDAAGLGAGVYLYRIEAGSEVTTGRMTLLD